MSAVSCRGATSSGQRCQNAPSRNGFYCHLHAAGSRYISEPTRTQVFEESAGHCHYCGKQLTFANRSSGRGRWEPDHLRPHSQGGANSADNLVAACHDCNRERSDTPVRAFGDGERRCEGVKADGTRCQFKTAPGKYKYCLHHAK